MRYEMRLNKLPFGQIVDGKKTIEVRLNDAKRKLLAVGDEVLFSNRDNPTQTIIKTIKDLRLYNSFAEMANNENCVLAGFDKGYTVQSVIYTYHTYYSPEEEQQFGVVVIELE